MTAPARADQSRWGAPPPGFEPGAFGLEVRCSIQLSYRGRTHYVMPGVGQATGGQAAGEVARRGSAGLGRPVPCAGRGVRRSGAVEVTTRCSSMEIRRRPKKSSAPSGHRIVAIHPPLIEQTDRLAVHLVPPAQALQLGPGVPVLGEHVRPVRVRVEQRAQLTTPTGLALDPTPRLSERRRPLLVQLGADGHESPLGVLVRGRHASDRSCDRRQISPGHLSVGGPLAATPLREGRCRPCCVSHADWSSWRSWWCRLRAPA